MRLILFVAVFVTVGATAFGKTSYYSGRVGMKVSGSQKIEPVDVAYLRDVKDDEQRVIETVDSIFSGKRYREIYTYDFVTHELVVTDRKGKTISTTPFRCKGTFPKLASCSYDFKATFEVKGEDVYHADGSLQFKSTVKDPRTGVTYVTDGSVPKVSSSQYLKQLQRFENTSFAPTE